MYIRNESRFVLYGTCKTPQDRSRQLFMFRLPRSKPFLSFIEISLILDESEQSGKYRSVLTGTNLQHIIIILQIMLQM